MGYLTEGLLDCFKGFSNASEEVSRARNAPRSPLSAIEVAHSKNYQTADNQSTAYITKCRVRFGSCGCRRNTADAKDLLFVLDSNLGKEKANDAQYDGNDAGPGRFVHMAVFNKVTGLPKQKKGGADD